MGWLRLLALMWFLVRLDTIDGNWDLTIIGGYDTLQMCRSEQERSLWGLRVFCARATTPPMLW